MTIKKFYLRFQNRLYVSVIIFLGMFAMPLVQGCSNAQDAEKEQQRIKDSTAAAQHQLDSLTKVKEDSIASALRAKEIQDSIRKADSIKNAKPKPKPVNPYKPNMTQTKYGVPANFREE